MLFEESDHLAGDVLLRYFFDAFQAGRRVDFEYEWTSIRRDHIYAAYRQAEFGCRPEGCFPFDFAELDLFGCAAPMQVGPELAFFGRAAHGTHHFAAHDENPDVRAL